MPAAGFLKRARSLQSRRAGNTLETSSESVSPRNTRNEEAPYELRRMDDLPLSGTATTFHQLSSPTAANHVLRKQHGLTNYHFFSSSEAAVDNVALDAKTIGLALGSPRERSLPFSLAEDPPEERRARPNTPDSTSTAQSRAYENSIKSAPQKPKLIKWKSFGGFFGKKNAVSPSARVYQVQPSSSDAVSEQGRPRHLALGQIRSSEDQITRAQKPLVLPSQQRKKNPKPTAFKGQRDQSSQRQSNADTCHSEVEQDKVRGKPELWHSHTCPTPDRRDRSPLPPSKDIDVKPATTLLQCKGGSLLEVEIPSVQLERYSVMFENLLQQPPSSTLLARRQGQAKMGTPREDSSEKIKSDRTAPRLPLSRSEPSSLIRPSSMAFSRSLSPLQAPSSARALPPQRSTLHRSLTSPSLTSPKGRYVASPLSVCTEPGRTLLEVNHPKDSLATYRQQDQTTDHSRTSTVTSFYTAHESQPPEPIPRPSLHQQSLPVPTPNDQGGHLLRSTKSGALPAVSPVVPESSNCTRGRTAEVQDGKQKRNVSIASPQTSASAQALPPNERLQERKPVSTLRSLKHGYVSRVSPVQLPPAELAKQAAKAAALSMQDGKENIAGSDPAILPLSSHPPSPALISKYSSGVGTRPKVGRIRTTTTSAPATPLSTTPAPTADRTTNVKTAQPRTPKPTLFSPSPPTSPLSPLPQLPSGLPSPAELKSAAEISIARQISISGRQRDLLAPLGPKYARQPMQPMLVDVAAGSPTTARKSHHLVLEHV